MTDSNRARLTRSIIIKADAQRVFEALTDPEQLAQWFAEHAEVEPTVGGAYRFWGRYTYGVPTRAEANQGITRFQPHCTLAFSWTWESRAGEVVIHIKEDGHETALTLVHDRDATPGACDSAEDFWIVALGNLKSFVQTGRTALRPDLVGNVDEPEVRVSIDIDASIADVFDALRDPARLNDWIAAAARVSFEPNGEYSYGWRIPTPEGGKRIAGPSRIVELIPDRLLVTDWNHEPLGADSRVRWELEPIDSGRTRVTLTQNGFASHREHTDHTQGWARYLTTMKAHCEGVPASSIA